MPQTPAAPNRRPSKFSPRLLLWLLPALALLAAVPLVIVLAQAPPPNFFTGTVTIEGAIAPNGTRVAAMINGQEVASATVSNGRYQFQVPSAAGQTIAFKVGEWYAEESALFIQGGRTSLNLTVVGGRSTSPVPTPAPTPTPTPRPTSTPRNCAGQPPPPHFFIGLVSLNGQPAPSGTLITALVDGQEVVTMAVTSAGSYQLRVEQCNTPLNGKSVSFTVGGADTGQTVVWSQGGRTRLNLAASGGHSAPTSFHSFSGYVSLNNLSVLNGTPIVAMIGGQEVARTTVSTGRYLLSVPGATGQFITFTIGGRNAAESATFEPGRHSNLNLTSTTRDWGATPTPLPGNCAAQWPQPHRFAGTALLNGRPAPNGTVIAALIDGQQMVTAAVTGGSYSLRVQQCNTPLNGQRISFIIDGLRAEQTAVWRSGNTDVLNLAASSDQPASALHTFTGWASRDYGSHPNGTPVVAIIDGRWVAFTTIHDGRYLLNVPGRAGQTVTFMINGRTSAASATFAAGKYTTLYLGVDCDFAGVYRSVTDPWFRGTARLNGQLVADGTVITALVDGQETGDFALTIGGSYQMVVQQCERGMEGQRIGFAIDGAAAAQTAVWSEGAQTTLNLTTSALASRLRLPLRLRLS